MFFGVWNKARDNKENIFYAIVTIVLLERVRTGWNRIETAGRRRGIPQPGIETRQRKHLIRASLLYGLLLVLPVVKYIFRSIEELSWTVPDLAVLKNTWTFFAVTILVEAFLAIVIYNLLKVYVDRMNAAIGFFKTIGRNIWDGSKMAVQVGTNVGSRVVGGVRAVSNGTRAGLGAVGSASHRTYTRIVPASVRSAPARSFSLMRSLGNRVTTKLRRRPHVPADPTQAQVTLS